MNIKLEYPLTVTNDIIKLLVDIKLNNDIPFMMYS